MRLSGKPRILILCEGAQTEPNYFNWLKFQNRLTSVVVRPPRGRQSGPQGLLKRLKSELKRDSGWDEVYCVLDHDERTVEIDIFKTDLARLNNRRASTRIEMVLSNPCFELWLLLHYEFTDRPYASLPEGSSACNGVTNKLLRHIPNYSKNSIDYLNGLVDRVTDALVNAGRLNSLEFREGSEHLPHTDVNELVARLLKIND
ncbi:MAG: RloB family protein [Gammaproteobacteria bacterium]|nr:RloB family protein [Gammaproteobacteria bacterium]